MSSTVEQVKAKLGIVEVISGYIKLEKAGINWKARCPFHNEKTPSFFVSPTRQSYHCFGCNRGGDIISFVEEMEGLDFIGALKLLAERAGVPMERLSNSGNSSEKENLTRVLESAQEYYQSELRVSRPVLDYLHSRGLTDQTITDFRLGFAPDGWQNLVTYLKNRNFSDNAVMQAGLALHSDKSAGIYDRFRSRIMFPITDAGGRVVGFSGRIFGPETEKTGGKYVNSPETPVYNKSKVLYGYDRAKVAIRRLNQCVIVEGQMDLLLSHQAGFTNTVAVSGTALTAEHLALVRRLTENVVMAFDGDEAGLNAASRSVALALGAGFNVKLVAIADAKDPADLIKEDKKLWLDLLENSKPVIDFWLDILKGKNLDKLALIHEVERLVYPYLALIQNSHDRDHYIGKVTFLTQLSENSVREKLQKLKVATGQSDKIETEKTSRREKILASLFGLWWWGQDLEKRLKDVLADEFATEEGNFLAKKNELTLVAELAYAGMSPDRIEREITELFTNLSLELYEREVENLRYRLSKEPENEQKILEELSKVYKKISDLKNKR